MARMNKQTIHYQEQIIENLNKTYKQITSGLSYKGIQ